MRQSRCQNWWLPAVVISLTILVSCMNVADASASLKLYNSLFGPSQLKMRKIRPSDHNQTDILTLYLGLQLSQLIDVDEKNQIMTTNVWLRHSWYDETLQWNPSENNGIDKLYIPPNLLWIPDVVLYNNADGNYVVTLMTKVTVLYDGHIFWEPPAIFKSSCQINVEFFPFDEQECFMKFGTWTYDGFHVDLKHIHQKRNDSKMEQQVEANGDFFSAEGIGLGNFYDSVEWDITDVPAQKSVKKYLCCVEPYPDIFFYIKIRRKTLFYTINLIVPCIAISFLTIFVFYLPSDSGEKITLSVSILLALTVFFLLLAEIIPPTSFVVPLIGKYLIFTMVLVTLSIIVTVLVLNVHCRDPVTNDMSPWVRKLFLCLLPKMLLIKRPVNKYKTNSHSRQRQYDENVEEVGFYQEKPTAPIKSPGLLLDKSQIMEPLKFQAYCIQMEKKLEHDHTDSCKACLDAESKQRTLKEISYALDGIKYITEHLQYEDFKIELRQDWHFAAMVMDRIFLVIFSVAVLFGTVGIVLQAPSIFNKKPAINSKNANIDV